MKSAPATAFASFRSATSGSQRPWNWLGSCDGEKTKLQHRGIRPSAATLVSGSPTDVRSITLRPPIVGAIIELARRRTRRE